MWKRCFLQNCLPWACTRLWRCAWLFFPFGLLDRLYDFHPLRLIALVSRILIQGARHRKRIHCVSHLLVVGLARNGLTDKYDQTSHRYNDGVLDRVPFFLAAVTLLLHVPVCRTGNLPFRAGRGISRSVPSWRSTGLPPSLESSASRSASSLSVSAGTRPLALRDRRRIFVRQWMNMLQCFWFIPKQAAWYSCNGLFFK